MLVFQRSQVTMAEAGPSTSTFPSEMPKLPDTEAREAPIFGGKKYTEQELLEKHYDQILEHYQQGAPDESDEYSSDEEAQMLQALNDEEREMYNEVREEHVRQLVSFGYTMPLSREIRRHMFWWLPGCPRSYTKRASEAVHRHREREEKKARESQARAEALLEQAKTEAKGDKTKEKEILAKMYEDERKKREAEEAQAPPAKKAREEIAESDCLIIRVTPGMDPLFHKVFGRDIKQEPVEAEADVQQPPTLEREEIEEEESEEDDEGVETAEREFQRKDVVDALMSLEAASKQQVTAYQQLRHAIPSMEEADVKKVAEKIPTPLTVQLSDEVRKTLEEETDQTLRYMLALGEVQLQKYVASTSSDFRPRTQKQIAARFNITQRKLSELIGGRPYKGGTK